MNALAIVGLAIAVIIFVAYESDNNNHPRGGGTAVVCG